MLMKIVLAQCLLADRERRRRADFSDDATDFVLLDQRFCALVTAVEGLHAVFGDQLDLAA